MVKYTGRGLVVKRPGVLIKVQMLTLVLESGGLFPSSNAISGEILPKLDPVPFLCYASRRLNSTEYLC